MIPSCRTAVLAATVMLLAGLCTTELRADTVVIDNDTYWSYYYIARGEQRKNIGEEARSWPEPEAGYPSETWYEPDFDARGWGMAAAPFPAGMNRWGDGNRATGAGAILVSTRFRVEQPDEAQLHLDLVYRGGAVVYLNGEEIARQDLIEPEDADTSVFDVPAEEYPFEAYYTHNRDPIDSSVDEDVEGELREHLTEYRLRKIEDLKLPADTLRRGENVLAIQLNAAPEPDRRHFFREEGWGQVRGNWAKLGLVEVGLDSRGEGGVAAGTTDESGLFISPINPLEQIDEQLVTALRHRPQETLRLVAPRGGYTMAPIVVQHDESTEAPQLELSSLRSEQGEQLPSQVITVFHGSMHHRDHFGADDGHRTDTHHILSEKPGSSDTLHSLWVEARVPRDAAPGRYTGEAVVEAAGDRRTVPVELHVGRFKMPPADQTVAHVGMLHNPENTARRYEVELWSDEHFELLGKVFDRMASIGNDVLYLPMAMDNHLGSSETLVRWIERDDGYEVDLEVLERYLKLFDERFGQPDVLGLYLWDVIMGGHRGNGHAKVTLLDPETGETSRYDAPWYGEQGSEAFWKPAIEGVLDVVDQLGWDRDGVMISSAHDGKPQRETREFFEEIAPDIPWSSVSHARGYRPREGELNVDGLEVEYHAYPWQADVRVPERGIIGGWDGEFLQTTLARFHFTSFSGGGRIPATYRALVSNAISVNRSRSFRGVSRFQLDYWPVPSEGGDGFTRLLRMGGWVNLMRNHEFLLAPGPDGPEPTVSFAQLREGVQETEARIAIEMVLADEDLKALLDDDLLDRAYEVIREHGGQVRAGSRVWQGYVSLPWREHAQRLFDTAGEVLDATGRESGRWQ